MPRAAFVAENLREGARWNLFFGIERFSETEATSGI
jgi:hypothetical protein